MKENTIFASIKLKDDDDRKNAVSKAIRLQNSGVEGIVIREKYLDDSAHEENLSVIKKICEEVSIPVYGKVNDGCDEDVKKYLYAGCKGVIIKEDEEALISESVKRFQENSVKTNNNNDKASTNKTNIEFSDLKIQNGLIPCIVQDYMDGTVLMLAYMNEEAFNKTISSGTMTYFSRSRNKLWVKGEESGHFQELKSLTADCDNDTLLAKVKQTGVACHTGKRSCFFNDIVGENDYEAGFNGTLNEVYEIIYDRKNNPKEGSYTNYLFDKGIDKILKKVGEESTEIVIAAKNPEKDGIIYEIADLIYHLSVLMADKEVTWDDIYKELKNR